MSQNAPNISLKSDSRSWVKRRPLLGAAGSLGPVVPASMVQMSASVLADYAANLMERRSDAGDKKHEPLATPKPGESEPKTDHHSSPEESSDDDLEEELDETNSVIVEGCGHRVNRKTLKKHVRDALRKNKYPIVCPECLSSRGDRATVSSLLAGGLDVTEEELEQWRKSELEKYALELECPKCKQSYMLSRDDYYDMDRRVTEFKCPLKSCDHVFCRDCLKTKEQDGSHECEWSEANEDFVNAQGWGRCPRCKAIAWKDVGCNLMTCTTLGCNTKYCYRCHKKLIKPAEGDEIQKLLDQHQDCKPENQSE